MASEAEAGPGPEDAYETHLGASVWREADKHLRVCLMNCSVGRFGFRENEIMLRSGDRMSAGIGAIIS